MANLTNSGLVSHCKSALRLRTKYMWGGLMREITPAYISMLYNIYGSSQYSTSRLASLRAVADTDYFGCDCVGLIKSYIFGGIGVAKNAPNYNKLLMWDQNVEGMYRSAKTKGKITAFPKVPGLLVMTSTFSHVGVYIGDDYVIECTLSARGDGVVKTKIEAGGWGLWCQHPFIEDNTTASFTSKVKVCSSIYESLGIAARRTGASISSNFSSGTKRCVRNGLYPIKELVTASNGSVWLHHVDGAYSAMKDTDGSLLFKLSSSFKKTKTIANCIVRNAATLDGTRLAKLYPNSEVVLITGRNTSKKCDGIYWVKIVYNNSEAWVDRQWIE